jgi:hypothetical protein
MKAQNQAASVDAPHARLFAIESRPRRATEQRRFDAIMRPHSPTSGRQVYRLTVCRPRARACCIIAVALCLATLPAVQFLVSGNAKVLPWGAAFCWLIVLAHTGFVAAALWYGFREKPQTIKRRLLDPNYSEAEV